MARGSALAMSGCLPDAVACFTAALEHDPALADGWKRRGQVEGDDFIVDLNRDDEQRDPPCVCGRPKLVCSHFDI